MGSEGPLLPAPDGRRPRDRASEARRLRQVQVSQPAALVSRPCTSCCGVHVRGTRTQGAAAEAHYCGSRVGVRADLQ